jgi:diguanylate cyclase (GGDEF)-like protein/PAS domain S-box-containing protein
MTRRRWKDDSTHWIVGVTLAYVLLFLVAASTFGAALHALASVPLIVAAWMRGTRGVLLTWPLLVAPQLAVAVSTHGASVGVGAVAFDGLALLGLGLALGILRNRTDHEIRTQFATEARYERAARGANDVLFEWELDTGSAYFSAQWPHLLGAERAELTPRIGEWLERVHPEDLPGLRREIEVNRSGEIARFEFEHRVRRKDGTYAWVRARGVASRPGELGAARITGWLTDISEEKRSEAQLRRVAFQDALTGLPNRALFMDRLRKAEERHRGRNARYAVLLTDLDRFKVVNDSLGHAVGDSLVVKVSRLLRDTLRPSDTIARLGGDEFAVLLEELERPEQAEELANSVLAALSEPIDLDGQRVVVGASIGLASGGDGREVQAEDLLREADIAMYTAKARGGGHVDRYDGKAHGRLSERLDIENELRRALEGRSLHVHYQPIVDVIAGTVVGFEALARWQHPKLGPVSPATFIPVAEEAGLIEQLGECVLRMAVREAEKLRASFPDAPAWRMGVNLSVAQLARTDLCARVMSALEESGLPPEFLSLEITESVRLAMDDFGTGYSSLQYLRRFRIDTLKIDGSFVRDLDHAAGEEICAAVISLGRDLGLSVIAEGVERPEELARLKQLGGRYAQGFLLSRPLAPEQLVAWLGAMPGWRLALAG